MDKHQTLSEKVSYMHAVIKDRFAAVDRIAIAKYDYGSDTLRTYVSSTNGENPLILHEARLSDVPSLLKLVQSRETRVINNLSVLADRTSVHSTKIIESGFRSSYTVPLFHEQQFIGILFSQSHLEAA